ncbi:hypothetical protein MPDQ_004749 [Monascus purpureus]|uniref:MARVEL domain-containing protein n=1 Tax=Monascus purpureus TaxID=5098 RepID=A0A507QZL0_MONPU|nr:hypothetical protein MPDQ_004749 [Monascus purpureus]BDD62846.1 hypothetical protein MAP00_007803 [Monascus purpureus]
MRPRSVKPSFYSPFPFHAVRLLILLSAIVVVLILIVFIVQLHSKSLSLPWPFVVQIAASALSIIEITLTTLLYCAHGLNPRFSLTLNSILFVLWAICLGLLSYAMANTIMTSCTTAYWGTSTGIRICRTYKALFAFTALAVVGHLTAAFLDVIARNRETHRGKYGRMSVGDVKPDEQSDNSLISDGDLYHRLSPLPAQHNAQPSRVTPPPAYHTAEPYNTVDLAERHHAGEAAEYYDATVSYSNAGSRGRGRGHVRTDTGDSESYYGEYGHSSEASRLVPGSNHY